MEDVTQHGERQPRSLFSSLFASMAKAAAYDDYDTLQATLKEFNRRLTHLEEQYQAIHPAQQQTTERSR